MGGEVVPLHIISISAISFARMPLSKCERSVVGTRPSAPFSIAHKAGTGHAVGDSRRAVTPSQLQTRHAVSARLAGGRSEQPRSG